MSLTCVKILTNICEDVTIETDVISNDISLLLSKDTMKNVNTVINFPKAKVSVFSKKINLRFMPSSHYVVPINRNSRTVSSSSCHAASIDFSDSLSLHLSQSSITPSRSSKLHPASPQS